MKNVLIVFFFLSLTAAYGQGMINPTVKGFGGIMDAPHAIEKPDPNKEYKIVIDIATGSNNAKSPFYSLINVARLMNLHAMGGVPKENMKVAIVIHGGAIWSVLNNEDYKAKYEVDNPHIALFQELKEAGVEIFVCSQSLLGRSIDHETIVKEVEVATSMLTVMTTYQLNGYAALKF